MNTVLGRNVRDLPPTQENLCVICRDIKNLPTMDSVCIRQKFVDDIKAGYIVKVYHLVEEVIG